ncbi:MAG: serine acetyltransferase [bacterium]|nr:serine acetyltransferase [bacterium]
MTALKVISDRAESTPRAGELAHVIDALTDANVDLLSERVRRNPRQALPSRDALERVLVDLRAVLFPAHFGTTDRTPEGIRHAIALRLEDTMARLQDQVRRGLLSACTHGDGDCVVCGRRAAEVVRELARRLPAIRALLGSDVRAAYEGDPAATSMDEAIFCYPGIAAITHHRLAHQLYEFGVPLIPRIIAELAHAATGIDIHPGANIAGSFFIDHGTGVVVGETSVIGQRVRLYQGVTLGARSFPVDESGRPIKGRPRHPIVEDDVTIYAGATILGRITIGRGSSIGGNVWLTRGVPPGSYVSQAQSRDDLFDGGLGI